MQRLSKKAIITNFVGTLFTSGLIILYLFFVVLAGGDELFGQLGISPELAVLAGVVVLALLVGYSVLWVYLYRYGLEDSEFKKESGVIAKDYVSIPYSRIQNVNIERSLLERVLGISSVQIQTAGGGGWRGNAEGRIPGVDKHAAEKLREDIIERARAADNGGGL